MRGAAKSQFDGDIIMKIDKGDDYKQNEVYHDKNHYQNKDLSRLRYYIYSQYLSSGLLTNKLVPKQTTSLKNATGSCLGGCGNYYLNFLGSFLIYF